MPSVGVGEFIRQVKQEASKVSWGTRKDTIQTTTVVLVMIVIMSLVFLAVDAVIFNIVQMVLGL